MEMTCLHCNIKFKSDRQRKFCCRNCYLQYTRNENLKNCYTKFTCEYCGKEFLKQNKAVRAQKAVRFCSLECLNASQKQGNKIVQCTYCGKEIERTAFQIQQNSKHYCSKECHYKDKKTGETKHCRVCGKPIYVIPSRADYYNKFYCSSECRMTDFLKVGQKIKPLANEEYKALADRLRHTAKYLRWRSNILAKHPKCTICGTTEGLNVHHIISLYEIAIMFNFDYNAIVSSDIYTNENNGVVICRTCHGNLHFGDD